MRSVFPYFFKWSVIDDVKSIIAAPGAVAMTLSYITIKNERETDVSFFKSIFYSAKAPFVMDLSVTLVQ